MRTLKIGLSSLISLGSAGLFILNVNPLYTIISGCVLTVSFIAFTHFTIGFYVPYLEELSCDFKSTIENIDDLFNSALNSIKIVSATFNPQIYFEPKVFKPLKEAKNRGVKIEIILTKATDEIDKLKFNLTEKKEASNEFWKLVKDGYISIKLLARNCCPHFIIVDNRHVRIEERHKIKMGQATRKIKRRAITKYLDPDLGKKYSSRFQRFTNKAVPHKI